MAVRVEPPPASLIVSRGRYSSWLTTLDHKRIGILYMVDEPASSSSRAGSSRC